MGGGPVSTPSRFPFSAVVGHHDMKLALLLNAVDPRVGGVLLRGHKGSAKSTVARALAGLLTGDAPFVELPIGATEDRLVGTLDLEAAIVEGRRRFQPGLLAAAHGGVLYVDEVNLLPDHLVDVLLDVAASGVNRVEREGISESHPSRFVLIGSMNPEEGELRPQLLDRFGLAVDVTTTTDPDERAEAVRRRLAFDADPVAFGADHGAAEDDLRARLAATRVAEMPGPLLRTISTLCASVGAEGLRADLVIARAAAALAGWEGRTGATVDDVRTVAPLALAHRRRRSPFEEPGIAPEEIDDALADQRPAADARTDAEPADHEPAAEQDGPAAADDGPEGAEPADHEPAPEEDEPERGDDEPATEEDGPEGDERPSRPAGERQAEPDAPAPVIRLTADRTRQPDAVGGRRSPVQARRGRLVGDRVPDGPVGSLAVGATARAAAVRRATEPHDDRLVAPADLREAVREQRAGNLLVLAVDASGSMGAQRRMEAVKGALLGLLLDAYQRRDRVALVTFRDDGAEVVLRPTGSVEVARSRLVELRTGGRTPLAAGIEAALGVAVASPANGPRPLLVLLSDGRATAAGDGTDPVEAALGAAALVRRREVPAVVIDAEDGPTRLGLAAAVADAMGARLLSLPELSATSLTGALQVALRR